MGIRTLDPALVPTRGLVRDGVAKHVFLRLWSHASTTWPGTVYRKSEWNLIDALLFRAERDEAAKRELTDAVSRQWAAALDLPGYVEEDWAWIAESIQAR
jgi:hypothetical protein